MFDAIGTVGYEITDDRTFLKMANDFGLADDNFKKWLTTVESSGTVYKTSEDALSGYQAYLKSTSKAAQFADLKTKALSASMKVFSTIGWMALFAGISWTIGKAVEGIDHLINHEKYAQKALESALETSQKFKDSISNTREELSKTKKSVSEIASEYAKLSQGVDIYTNENISLTNEQYEEFVSLNNQLAELFPSLTRNYDENGNAILGLGGSVESVTDKIQTLIEQQERLATIEMRKSLEGYVNGDEDGNGGQIKVLKGLEDNLAKAENELTKFQEKYDAIFNGEQVNEHFLNRKQLVKAKDYYKNAFGLTEEELKKSTVIERNFLGEGVYRLDFENLEIDESRKEEILESYHSFYKEINDNVLYAQSELDSANKEMSNMMMMWVEDESLYKDGGNTFQTLIQSMIGDIDWNQLGLENYDDVKTWIKDNIFRPISSVDGDDKNVLVNALNNLLSLDLNNFPIGEVKEKIDEYLAVIAEILGQESADKFKVNLSFDVVDTSINNVKGKLQDEFDDKVGELSLEDLEIAANKLEIDPSIPLSWDELIAKIEEYKDSLKEDTEPPIFSLSDESITTAIDDFQKKIKTLQNAISDFQNNAEFDKTDLFQEFPELIHQSDNLESAIENLMQNALEELLETLNNPPDELRRELEKLVAVISVDTKQAVEDNLSSYRELYNILHMVQAGENIQQNVLATLINKYGDLAGAVVRTTDGYTLEEKAVTTLINKYVESSNTAIAAQIDITKQTIDNIKARISAYQTETRALNELVAAQTRQYQTIGEYLSAKGNGNVLDQNAIRDASARFGADAVSSYVDYIKNGGASQIKELEDAEAYLEKLKKSLKSPLESKSSSSSESSNSKSTSEIDWMTNSINNLQSAVDGLEQSFNNAKGIKNQKNALKELNKELHTLRDSYYSLTDNSNTVYGEYSKRYKGSLSQLGSNSASIKAKIEAGDIFDLSEFRSDTAELINAAIDAWNGMTDSKNKYIELGVQLEENSVKLIQMDIDAISSKMDLANIKLDSSVSDDRKLKIYDDLAKKTEEYYIKKLELAKLEEDSVQYDSLKVEKANALKDIEEEKLEIIRKQNDAVVDGIDRQINNINTSVELNGGKYLSSDYDNLLLLNEQKMAQLLSNYNRELTNLSDLRAAIGENSAEYREQKSRVDSIADSIDDCKINSKEWTKALLELPIKEIETSVKNLNEQLSGVKDSMSDVEQMISGATAYIKQEIEDQQKLKNVIQEQLDNLKNSNSEHERAIALQKAQYELDRAYKQKTTKVYRDGQGFVYEQSQSAIRTAQENLNKANYDIAIAALEKQLDYYDEIIEELQEVQDKWSNLTGKAQEFLDIQVAISKLGIDKILSGDGIDTYTDYYTALLENQNVLEESVASLEDLQVRLEDIVDMYHMGMIDASQATSLLRDALAGVYGAINTETGESIAASIQNIINRIKELNGINFTFDELILRISDVFTEFQQANYEDIDTFAGKISNLIEQFYKLESAGDVTAISDWLSSIKDLGGSDFIDAETIVDIIDLYRQTVSAASDTSAAADIVEETANNVETTVDAEKKKVNEAISDVEEDAKKGEEIISSLSEKIDLILSKLDELSSSEFMAKFSQEQLVQAESFTSQLENCFSSMAENIASNISSVFNNLNSELSRIASEAASTASSIHSMVSNANLKASELQTTKNQVAAITTSNTSNTIKQTSTGKFTMMKYHDGIENGLVGGKPEKVLQTAALDKLETNEIPALLEIDEAVLTRFQQNNIVENMKKSFTAGLNFIPQRDTSSINMQFGNINVTEVDNGQEVVDYLVSNLKPRIQQVLSKR